MLLNHADRSSRWTWQAAVPQGRRRRSAIGLLGGGRELERSRRRASHGRPAGVRGRSTPGPVAQLAVDPAGKLAAGQPPGARRCSTCGPATSGGPFQDLEVSYRPVELRSRIDQVVSRAAAGRAHGRRVAAAGSGEPAYYDIHVVPLFGAPARPARRRRQLPRRDRVPPASARRARARPTTSWSAPTRSCSPPTRSWRPPTRSSSPPTRSSRPPTRSSSPPTRSSRR